MCVSTESSLPLERWISQKAMGSAEMLKSALKEEDLPSPRHEEMKHQLVFLVPARTFELACLQNCFSFVCWGRDFTWFWSG